MDKYSLNATHLPADIGLPPTAPGTEIPSFTFVGIQLEQVRHLIHDYLADSAGSVDVKPLFDYVTAQHGKMLRPGLVLLSGGCCGKITDTHITVAAIVEMVHNATLLHDDVVDDGQIRRGTPTINKLWGNESAVLLGDYLLSRVFKMSADLEPPIAKIIATIAVRVCDGELRQALQRNNWRLSEAEYIDIITEKSAVFFSGCCRLGAILAGAPNAQVSALTDFGLDIGIAFQITDDLLDITGSQNQLGKNTDKDAVKSRLTLPVIHLLSVLDQTTRKKAHDLLHSSAQSKDTLKEMLFSFGSLTYARDKALEFVARATEHLNDVPSSAAKDALIEVAHFTAQRTV